ncbi:MAG: DUF3572 domain-containing protein [Alphaproteobacteria bacterium]|jgi:hypothetical protein|nr:DUF3572 domain-containing protein [Alphaproteobacteria bacterium]HJP22156.1 DUF3572 domain-containing protein [Alphaproteobacteria bacterium]
MTPESAETIALKALAFIAADSDELERLLARTGLTPETLRSQAGDPALLGGVLDFLFEQDDRLLAFCQNAGLAPEETTRARSRLPGGAGEMVLP